MRAVAYGFSVPMPQSGWRARPPPSTTAKGAAGRRAGNQISC
jgi:hypothetical protein